VTGDVRAVARFVEKPSASDAQGLVDAGWLWNSGNFVFGASTMLSELEALAPDLLAASRTAREAAVRTSNDLTLGEAFLAAPGVAIDVAVMERTARAAVLPVDYAWSDLGAWDAVLDVVDRDSSGNAVAGQAVVVDSEGCLVRAGAETRVVAIGLKDIAVIVDNGRVLVCDLARAQQVKSAAQAIEDS
jgi:mannose-1-phosphate guanylyltransferase